MSKRNAPCVIVDDLPFDAPAGHTKLQRDDAGTVTGIRFGCPCGCGYAYGASWRPGGWSWDGNLEKPTVTPSLGCYPAGKGNSVGPDGQYHWHGHLRAGVYEEC